MTVCHSSFISYTLISSKFYLNDVLAFSKCTTRQRVYSKGLIIEEVNFLVFKTLKHIMKDAYEIQTIESYSDI